MWLCYWHGDQPTARNVPQNTLSSLIEIGYNALVLNSKHMLTDMINELIEDYYCNLKYT